MNTSPLEFEYASFKLSQTIAQLNNVLIAQHNIREATAAVKQYGPTETITDLLGAGATEGIGEYLKGKWNSVKAKADQWNTARMTKVASLDDKFQKATDPMVDKLKSAFSSWSSKLTSRAIALEPALSKAAIAAGSRKWDADNAVTLKLNDTSKLDKLRQDFNKPVADTKITTVDCKIDSSTAVRRVYEDMRKDMVLLKDANALKTHTEKITAQYKRNANADEAEKERILKLFSRELDLIKQIYEAKLKNIEIFIDTFSPKAEK